MMNTNKHTLTNEEITRYSRQLLVSDFGAKGQEGLKFCKVLIVGAGGLGCPVATYLAGCGVGVIGIVDYDQVSMDNLHRQVAYRESCVGIQKVAALKEAIQSLNHLVTVHTHDVMLDKDNAMGIFTKYDIIVDCSDNPTTRYLINDASVLLKKPLVSGSALRWDGQLTVYNYDASSPCLRCVFPNPNTAFVTNCAEGGVFGPVVGTIGSLQALEVIKIASGHKPSYSGKLLVFDGLKGKMRVVNIRKRQKDCAVCGENPNITVLIDYQQFCGAAPNDKTQNLKILGDDERISVHEYGKIRIGNAPILLDTRPFHEFHIAALHEARNISLADIRKTSPHDILSRLSINVWDTPDVYVICHRGNDSQLAVEILKEKLKGCHIRDIRGGYEAWAKEVDKNFPLY